MTTTPKHFDHVLVGTGQALGTLVGGLPRDETVAVIEGNRIGGTCINVGCTPTKTLVASAKVAQMARRAREYGVATGPVEIDFAAVMARMDEPRRAANDAMAEWLHGLEHVTLLRGWASFVGPKTLRVGEERITGERIYLNVGARARAAPIPGLDEVEWLDNVRILDLTERPDHLIVVGGSYVGLEFAQIFRRLGSRVSVLQRSARLASREDHDVADAVRRHLEDEGIDVRVDAPVERVARVRDGVEVTLGRGERVVGSHLLLATGRTPNSDTLDLGVAGIETDEHGYITVDDRTRTSVDGVFALGDVNGRGAFTHTSVNDAEVVLSFLAGGDRRIADRIPVHAVFVDPPLGRVGLTEREAVERGHRVLVATREMSRISRAKEMGETKGFVKLLVDADTDMILGAAVLGVHGDEVINMFAAFMYSGKPCHEYRKAVLVHPTVSELMPFILDDLAPSTVMEGSP